MAEQRDAATEVPEVFAAHGLHPSDEELVAYSFLSQMLRALVDQLYQVEIDEEL